MRLVITNKRAYGWIRRRRRIEIRIQTLLSIAKRCATHIHLPANSLAHGDSLYDESGLPG
jgi:hypothetical protein